MSGSRKFERELLEQLELNARILEAMPGGIVHVSAAGAVQTANAEALRILGMSFDQATHRYTSDWEPSTYFEDGRPCSLAEYPVTLALVTGEPQEPVTIGVERPDGERVWAVFTAIPVLDPGDGTVTGAVVTFLDITEQRRVAERERELLRQALHAQKLESLGVLAGGIAHDFNNLLAGVIGHLCLGLDGGELSEAARGHLERALHTAERAGDLVAQILSYSGGAAPRREAVALGACVKELMPLLSASISKKADVKLALHPDLPEINGDPNQVQQVVMNLVINASEALEGQMGQIVVRTGCRHYTAREIAGSYTDDGLKSGFYCWLEVEDDGRGMDEQTRQRLCDPFFSDKANGRGLGLASVLGIVRSHAGALEVHSTEGQGSRLRVLFPAAAPPEGWRPSDPKAPLALVVDDEPIVLGFMVRVLARAGYEVLESTNGKAGLETARARRHELDIIVSDVTMPVMSGSEMLEHLRDEGIEVPVLLVSGFVEPRSRSAEQGPGVRFLAKPFRTSVLLEAVTELVEGSSA